MIITHFQRRPFTHNFSIERVFSIVRRALPLWVECRVAVCRHNGTNPLKLAYNLIQAWFRQAGVNHITGDINYLAWVLPRKRSLLTIHDCGSSMLRLEGWRRPLFRWFWLSIPVRRCALTSVVSEQTKQEVMRYTSCPEEKIRIVPNPVGEEFRSCFREFHKEMPAILQVGTGNNKNVIRVAIALRDIPCDFHIVGRLSLDDRRQLERIGIRYRVSYSLTGEQMVRAYEECDLVVFASTYEGFGMPIIEAQAVGRPVVTSNREPMISVAGGAACLVDPSDPESIRRGVLQVIEDCGYRLELVRRGYINARRFSTGTVAEAYMGIYSELAMRATRTVPRRAEALRPTILILLAAYLPGQNAGGPIRSIANLVETFGKDFAFRIITSDRDLRAQSPYPGVPVRKWVRVDKADVMYLPPRWWSILSMIRVIRQTDPEVLYINSLFSPIYSIVPMLLRWLKLIHPRTVLLAPRGELSAGALRLKVWKKHPFRMIAQLIGLHQSVLWHASTPYEAHDILTHFLGSDVTVAQPLPVHTACDLPDRTAPRSHSSIRSRKTAGSLRIAFLSRISRKKNLDGALLMLGELHGNVLFSIHGPAEDSRYWKQCQEIIRRLPANVRVEYRGEVPHEQVVERLAQSDLFFLPTHGENYGHVIAEALSAGCPVVISDQTAWRGLEEKGVGWDLSLNDPERFRTVLQRLIDMGADEFQEFSDRAEQYAAEHSSNREIFRSNLDLLNFAVQYPLMSGIHQRQEQNTSESSGSKR